MVTRACSNADICVQEADFLFEEKTSHLHILDLISVNLPCRAFTGSLLNRCQAFFMAE